MQNQPDKTEPVGLEYLEQTLRELGEFYYWPNHGNVGDLLIAEATRQYFQRKRLSWRPYDPHNPPEGEYALVYGGGGRFSEHWGGPVGGIAPLIAKNVKQCVILPHSFYRVDKELARFDARHILFCREQLSYNYVCSVVRGARVWLADDMALQYEVSDCNSCRPENLDNRPAGEDTETQEKWLAGMGAERMQIMVKRAMVISSATKRKIAFLLRTDAEKNGRLVSLLSYDISAEWNGNCAETKHSGRLVASFAKALEQADVVVTDRLHVAVMSMLLGKVVYMLDNDYGKLSAVYAQSMKELSNVHLLLSGDIWPEEILAAWKKLNSPWRVWYYLLRRWARRILTRLK